MDEIVISILGSIAFVVILFVLYDEDDNLSTIFKWIFAICALALLFYGIADAIDYGRSLDVNAIEVYRGNTTLDITYRDGVAIDTLVVLK